MTGWRMAAFGVALAAILLVVRATVDALNRRHQSDLGVRLVHAVGNWNVHEVGALLDQGADANSRLGGIPVLKTACSELGRPEIVSLLLTHGADPNAAVDSAGQSAMECAAAYNNTTEVQMLLAAGADPNAREVGGMTALMWAARHANPRMARSLLGYGADPGLCDSYGRTALDDARAGSEHPNNVDTQRMRPERRAPGYRAVIALLRDWRKPTLEEIASHRAHGRAFLARSSAAAARAPVNPQPFSQPVPRGSFPTFR